MLSKKVSVVNVRSLLTKPDGYSEDADSRTYQGKSMGCPLKIGVLSTSKDMRRIPRSELLTVHDFPRSTSTEVVRTITTEDDRGG
jgi:hypothetical protein